MNPTDYVDLFGEQRAEPGVKEPKAARVRTPTDEVPEAPTFYLGAVKFGEVVLAWSEDGKRVERPLTAALARVLVQAFDKTLGIRIPAGAAVSVPLTPGVIVEASPHPSIPSQQTATAPYVRGSATSKAAAAQVTRKLSAKREAVLRTILGAVDVRRAAGNPDWKALGVTDNELVETMKIVHDWSVNTPRARRIELVTDGWLEDSGERKNGSTVWRPTAKAWEWWNQQRNGGTENP